MRKHGGLVLAAFLGALFAVVICGQLEGGKSEKFSDNSPNKKQSWRTVSMTDASTNNVEINPNMVESARLGQESVVHIRSITRITGGMPPGEETGSGVIISDDGLIVTNSHVVNGADRILVTLPSLYEMEAELVAEDPITDIALLRIPDAHTVAIDIGNSDKLQVGEWVLAVGNPLNLSSSVTAGIVSGVGRSVKRKSKIQNFECFIQTDAVLNKGSSGGALLNTKGELVGINTAIASETGKFEGYSFSIPSNVVIKVAEDLESYKVNQKAFLGAELRNLESPLDDKLKLESLKGAYVARLIGKSERGTGLYEEDIIRSINGVAVNSAEEVEGKLAQYRPGQTVEFGIMRDQETRRIELELKNAYNEVGIFLDVFTPVERFLGAEISNMTEKELKKNYLTNGIKVERLHQGLITKKTDIEPDFVITKINNREVRSVEGFYNTLKRMETGDYVTIVGFYLKNPEVKHYHFVMP